ncbi:MAG: 16S rRNA (cytosine(1402)-N(4))-methyltransferase RsmH [Clostridium sp.]|nr:16S rRNA (cytosine(1402)-N(4))-methyltransferase RsmH [Bacteroides sp.]MCM1198886.1 16S rRNA (cytosine(1402)-N(4))-methyltransferase RsmH [Clostridium sp.]
MSEYHIPVLLEESVSALIGNIDGIYADATFGGGGHTAEILGRLSGKGRVMAFDRDEDAIRNAAEGDGPKAETIRSASEDGRLILVRNNFRFIHNYTLFEGFSEGLDGILADLGVSSHQFDTPERGFSFRYDAALDMRMNKDAEQTAADIVNTYSEEDIERIMRLYGEVDNSRRIASMICRARISKAIATTGDLGNAIKDALPKFAEHKFLAKVYQALRIEVNQEMKSLEKFLYGAQKSLRSGGRLVVITYHSLEDRMVKNFIRSGNVDGKMEKDIFGNTGTTMMAVNRKPILPQEQEIAGNTRARSAKLRIAEKI